MPLIGLAEIFVHVYGSISIQTGTDAKGMPGEIWLHTVRHLYHVWQLWRCPVSWCTIWKGTAQDCVDHVRKAHDTPIFVKAANLARWFPPWTVTREQWHSMSRPDLRYSYRHPLAQPHWSAIVPPISGS